jgi:ABC-type dipeptide/oligopeptide/nickel transport system permease component
MYVITAIGTRLFQTVTTLLLASVVIWALLPLAPGDPILQILKARGIDDPNPSQIEHLRTELALDRPLPLQYLEWLGRLAHGNLGLSYRTGQPVLNEFAERVPATFLLLGLALVISVALSLLLSLISARWHGYWADRVILAYTRLGAAIPAFVLALVVLQYLIVGAGWGSVLGDGSLRMALWPAAIIGFDRAASWTQLLRASLLENLRSSHVMVARARGATELRVLLAYALPNSLLPFLTAIGVSVGAMIGGAPIIEEIFTWPGIGRHVLQAISARDYPVIQAFVLVSGLSYVLASLLIDLVAIGLDPRLRERR